jgi:hypothetical protein
MIRKMMRIIKRRKKVVARTSHVHKKLLGRKGTPVNARIMSYPVRRFDDAYLGHESLIFKDSEWQIL